MLYAAVNGFLAVSLGAFAAHGFESIMAPNLLEAFSTGVDYHLYHSLALLGTAAMAFQFPEERLLRLAGNFFMLGILFFSGSLYFLGLSGISWLGGITPIGGVFFLAAWSTLILLAIKLKSKA